jgi:hypothetical protein
MKKKVLVLILVGLILLPVFLFADNEMYYGGSYDGYAIEETPLPIRLYTYTLYYGGSYDGSAMGTSAGEVSLPVELSTFTARQEKNSVILEWQTGSETDNLGFIIERKETNNEFIERASYANNEELKGAGNTSVRSDYTFTDNNVVSGVTYEYRISDVDYSGKVEILKTITINITENSTDIPKTYALNSAYPNPFNPTTTISYDLPNSSFVTISVYDITGNLVENLMNENKEAGSYSVKWNASNISSGIYLYRLVTNDFVSTKKLILLK